MKSLSTNILFICIFRCLTFNFNPSTYYISPHCHVFGSFFYLDLYLGCSGTWPNAPSMSGPWEMHRSWCRVSVINIWGFSSINHCDWYWLATATHATLKLKKSDAISHGIELGDSAMFLSSLKWKVMKYKSYVDTVFCSKMCVLLITRLLWLVGRLSARKPV